MSYRAVVGVLLLVACGDDSTLWHEEQLARLERECAALSVAECKHRTECRVIGGSRVLVEQECLGGRAELGCQADNIGCDTAITIGSDQQQQLWWFGNACLPAGFTFSNTDAASWSPCNPPPPTPPKPCAALSGDNCELDRPDCSAIEATAFDPARACVLGDKKVGCMNQQRGCTKSISYGRDSEGQIWRFANSCQPASFTQVMPVPAEQPQVSWSHCTN